MYYMIHHNQSVHNRVYMNTVLQKTVHEYEIFTSLLQFLEEN